MTSDFQKLKGKLFRVDRDGVRIGRVVSVDAGPRKGLRRIRLAEPRYEGRGSDGKDRWSWRGREYLVDGRDAQSPAAGVMVRGRVVRLNQWH